MRKEALYFSHANGFPAQTYRVLFSYLRDHFEISYTNMLGHQPEYGVDDNWGNLSNELIDDIDKAGLTKVIGVGHSLGGIATLVAAIKRPDLFKALVLLDPPIFSHPKAFIIQLLKKINKMSWVTPGGRTRRRKTHWDSFEDAMRYFESKPMFKAFDGRCLSDYIKYGFKKSSTGIELKFDPYVEEEIYKALPHNYRHYQGKLQIPAAAILGNQGGFISSVDKRYMEKSFGIRSYSVEGGHLFPFEHPEETALLIQLALKEIEKS